MFKRKTIKTKIFNNTLSHFWKSDLESFLNNIGQKNIISINYAINPIQIKDSMNGYDSVFVVYKV